MITKSTVCYMCKTTIPIRHSNLRSLQSFSDNFEYRIVQIDVKCKNGHTNAVDIDYPASIGDKK